MEGDAELESAVKKVVVCGVITSEIAEVLEEKILKPKAKAARVSTVDSVLIPGIKADEIADAKIAHQEKTDSGSDVSSQAELAFDGKDNDPIKRTSLYRIKTVIAGTKPASMQTQSTKAKKTGSGSDTGKKPEADVGDKTEPAVEKQAGLKTTKASSQKQDRFACIITPRWSEGSGIHKRITLGKPLSMGEFSRTRDEDSKYAITDRAIFVGKLQAK